LFLLSNFKLTSLLDSVTQFDKLEIFTILFAKLLPVSFDVLKDAIVCNASRGD